MREMLIAPEGFVYTDGEIYGRKIYLGINRSKDEFYTITEEEYAAIMNPESNE